MSKSAYCVLPWVHLATHPHGGVSLCCVSDHSNNKNMAREYKNGEDRFLRLGRDSIASLLNSDYFREVRQQMLSGQIPAACRGCFRQEEAGVISKRVSERRHYPLSEAKARELTSPDGAIEPDLRFVELRLGNNCNLKCRTCNPASSTKWRADYEALEKELPFVRDYRGMDGFDWAEEPAFWDELEKLTPNLQALYINGGEPMLYRRHFDYLRKLVDTGRAGGIMLSYSTNMTGVPDEVFEIWRQFKEVKIKASVDDLRERNRYIRYPTDWAAVERTLGKLRDGGVSVHILQTVSAMNVFYLDEFEKWASARGFGVAHNFVFDPDYLAVDALPLKVRRLIIAKIAPAIGLERAQAINGLFGRSDDTEKWDRFLKYTKALDRVRGESFESVFPELCALLRQHGFAT